MAIQKQYTEAEVARAIERAAARQRAEVARWLCYVGEQAVTAARRNGSYTDRTGNLRASIGYVAMLDGAVLNAGGAAATDGAVREYAQRCLRGVAEGGALVVVAGMQYASYVSARGYDVLESAELVARRLVKRLLAAQRAG